MVQNEAKSYPLIAILVFIVLKAVVGNKSIFRSYLLNFWRNKCWKLKCCKKFWQFNCLKKIHGQPKKLVLKVVHWNRKRKIHTWSKTQTKLDIDTDKDANTDMDLDLDMVYVHVQFSNSMSISISLPTSMFTFVPVPIFVCCLYVCPCSWSHVIRSCLLVNFVMQIF